MMVKNMKMIQKNRFLVPGGKKTTTKKYPFNHIWEPSPAEFKIGRMVKDAHGQIRNIRDRPLFTSAGKRG
jgi:hypothetical protein